MLANGGVGLDYDVTVVFEVHLGFKIHDVENIKNHKWSVSSILGSLCNEWNHTCQ